MGRFAWEESVSKVPVFCARKFWDWLGASFTFELELKMGANGVVGFGGFF